ncbi:type II toxin-antitoxin system PemK/MazF family toxin [Sanguibacter sp. 25GB23B1]|uniref:type II toxin-antitoxin system PemK/MazF family toxin n=1 Tax=Sanguibacter sp. 25GB23B1 TaxID=3156067 RepID=UPI0032B01D13
MPTPNWTSLLANAARRALAPLVARDGRGSAGSPAADPPPRAPRARGARGRSNPSPEPRPAGTTANREKPAGTSSAPPDRDVYPGDFEGDLHPEYSPSLDGEPDPGEIVWTWVPYEDDHARGKDRPVLVVGRDGDWLLALMLSSKDHSQDAADEARWGRRWLDIGSGPWDPQGRESQVRLDRVVRVDPGAVRREGAIMDRSLFERVTARTD